MRQLYSTGGSYYKMSWYSTSLQISYWSYQNEKLITSEVHHSPVSWKRITQLFVSKSLNLFKILLFKNRQIESCQSCLS